MPTNTTAAQSNIAFQNSTDITTPTLSPAPAQTPPPAHRLCRFS
jgi:hypothetical protein